MAEGGAQATRPVPGGAGRAPAARSASPRPAVPRRMFSRPGEAAERSAGTRSERSAGTRSVRGQNGVFPAPSRSPRQREYMLPAITAQGAAPPIVHDVIDSPGTPLDRQTRDFFESRFDRDLSGVRVHTDDRAAASAEAVGATAYAVGPHIVFGTGGFAPRTEAGRRLLAHELTHVLQSPGTSVPARGTLEIGAHDALSESRAHEVEAGCSPGTSITPGRPVALRRRPAPSAGAPANPSRARGPGAQEPVGTHDVTVTVRYIDDSTELGHRLVAQISRTTGIPRSALFQAMFSGAAERLHFALARSHVVKEGGHVRAAVQVSYFPDSSPVATIERIAPVLPEAPKALPGRPQQKETAVADVRAQPAKAPASTAATTASSSSAAPTLTPQQEHEAERAYYESTRQERLEAQARREAGVRAELPRLSRGQIYDRWKADSSVFIAAANTPGNGLNPEQMLEIYRLYWGDRFTEGEAQRIAIANHAADADFGRYFDAIVRFDGGDRDAMGPGFAEAVYSEGMGRLALGAVVDAQDFLAAAEDMNKSLTLDELTKFAIAQARPRLEMARGIEAWAMMGRGIEPALPMEGPEFSEFRGSVNGRPVGGVAAGEIRAAEQGSVNGRPVSGVAAGEIHAAEQGSVNGRPVSGVAAGEIDVPNVRPLAKPRVATKNQYWWANPAMKKGNFIKAQLENGRLSLTVKAHGPNRRSGSQLFDDVFNHFGPSNIKEFEALWVRDSTFADNYNEFIENVNNGMSETDAAWNTWTGGQLRMRGFRSVDVPPHESGLVRPVFRK